MKAPQIHAALPDGEWLPITHPFRPGTEDWMLQRVVSDFRRANTPYILVRERAAADIGNFVGVALYRQAWS
ncbi:MAG TPA: hypothetical protein VMF06_16080 [Candidatus Limnocylindria bacterium]|nr:hypothetical protein [Candidatus Limnocylindria bacterium]